MSSDRENRRQLYEQLVGQTVAERYEIVSLMGYGGMGAVYEAIQSNMDRRVALKYIPSHDPVTAKRFEREALTVSKLRHPNTVTVFDYGQSKDGFLFLSMELLSGRTLTDLIEHESPLEPKRAVHIASQVCRSLAEAHETGIVHRDIKPDNVILIEVDGDPDVVKVLDFGIAKAVEKEDQQTLTGDGRIIGTPRYMSPEQILSEDIDYRSDIYSLGCIIFEMLCGTPPFDGGSTTALMLSHAQDTPPPLAERLNEDLLNEVPLELENVVRRTLSKSPAERPQTTDDLRQQLQAALESHRQRPTGDESRPEPVDITPVDDDVSSETTGNKSAPSSNNGDSKTIVVASVTAAMVATLAVGLVGAAFIFLGDEDPADADDPIAAQVESPPQQATPPSDDDDHEQDESEPSPATVRASETHQLRIESIPDGARIIEGNEVLGTTPLNMTVDDPQPLDFVLSKEDYRDEEVTVEVDESRQQQTFSFQLDKQEEPARVARPQRRAEPTGTQEDDEPDDAPDDTVPSIELLDSSEEEEEAEQDEPQVPQVPTL